MACSRCFIPSCLPRKLISRPGGDTQQDLMKHRRCHRGGCVLFGISVCALVSRRLRGGGGGRGGGRGKKQGHETRAGNKGRKQGQETRTGNKGRKQGQEKRTGNKDSAHVCLFELCFSTITCPNWPRPAPWTPASRRALACSSSWSCSRPVACLF